MSDPISHPLVRRPSLSPRHRRSAGFTLVEILTVMAIILILIGLLFAAIKYARNSAARSRTLAQFDTLRGMLGELDTANHFSQSPPVWLWFDAIPTAAAGTAQTGIAPFPMISGSGFTSSGNTYVANMWLTATTTITADFWHYPFSLVNVGTTPPTPNPSWSALDAPGDVGDDSGTQPASQRNASFAVLNTQLAMQLLAAVPGNRSALDKLPANSKMMPNWDAGPVLQPAQSTAGDYAGLLKEDGTDPTYSTATYLQGVHIAYQGHYFTCVVSPTTVAPTYPFPASPQTTPWLDETAAARGAPVLLDGWGNPIIYVPATGLHIKKLNGQGTYLPSDPTPGPTQEFIIISPEGQVSGNGTANPVVLRPGRPFFASAGPDGDFTKGEDNLYSFEN